MSFQIYVWNFKDNADLIGMAFIDTQVYVNNMLSMKNLVLTSDIVKSVQLLRFQVCELSLSYLDGVHPGKLADNCSLFTFFVSILCCPVCEIRKSNLYS